MKLLKEEGKRREQHAAVCSDVSIEDYVAERILRAMAKRSGLVLNDEINLHKMVSVLFKKKISGIGAAFSLLGESLHGLALLSRAVIYSAAKKSASVGSKAAAKAAGRVSIKDRLSDREELNI